LATSAELRAMARHRLEESQVLYDRAYFGGAYYLAGYAVEFGLKAIISKNLGVEIFDGDAPRDQVKSFHIHSLSALILFAGLRPLLEIEVARDQSFCQIWNRVSTWDEAKRYEFGCQRQTAADFLKAVKDFLTWIEARW
jgi:hypothetical protein